MIGNTYPWGEALPTPEPANFASELANLASNTSGTTPVTSHPDGRTPEGIHHLAGNVYEWCRDRYDSYSEGKQVDPLGPESSPPSRTGETRFVLRGGAFGGNENFLRGAYHNYYIPEYGTNYIGFRVAWSAAGGQMN